MAQPFDVKRLALAGDATPLAEKVQHWFTSALGFFSTSETGVLAYQTGADLSNVRLTWFDRGGNRLGSQQGIRPTWDG